MNGWTVFITVLSGTCVFVSGQIVLQFVIVPVQDFLKTIAAICHARVEHAQVTANPGVLSEDRMNETSQHLRRLSAQLHSHLFLVRPYVLVSRLFTLPSRNQVLQASRSLIRLSNSVFSAHEKIYQSNASSWENICDTLGIYIEQDDRWPKE